MAERQANGRFAKGNQAAKGHDGSRAGRPLRAVEEAYLQTVQRVMPTDRWNRCCEAYAKKAENGERYPFAFFANYLMGKPVEYKEQLGEVVIRVVYDTKGTDSSAESPTS